MSTAQNIVYFIGIDVSKYWLDYVVLHEVSKICQGRIDNNEGGFTVFEQQLLSHGILLDQTVLITIEDSGIYCQRLVDFLLNRKSQLCVENPLKIKRSIGLARGKNDKIDSHRIAEYSKRHLDKLRPYKGLRKPVKILKELISNRDRLVKAKRMLEMPLSEMEDVLEQGHAKKFEFMNSDAIDGIKISIKEIEREIKKTIESDIDLAQQYMLLRTVPGIGNVMAVLLISYTNEFTLFKTGKQLSSYAGVVPFKYISGMNTTARGHVSKISNSTLKHHLHIGIIGLLQHNMEIRDYYVRKVKEGKHKTLVLNNIKNKTLLRVAAVIRRGKPFQDDYDYKQAIRTRSLLGK